MKTMAKRAGEPRGQVRVGEETRPLDPETAALLAEGWRQKEAIAAAEERLREINAALLARHGAGAVLVLAGVCRATTAARQSVTVEDAERLRAVLGDRFDDLVRSDTVHRPEARLVEMALSADEPLAPALRAALAVRESTTVTWRAERQGGAS
ncbi:hypothetical protein [Elioraea sp.]|uniref:hypothetical protein n=1 Tax=Elioraea sp. TaxID=2185103 RepID=UPI0021DEED62|nr:hypothetical protein [Elioraea sp.]GIX12028.1 MAG: hypothetical protein KatS3mg116_3738 [Elioraea sp.]